MEKITKVAFVFGEETMPALDWSHETMSRDEIISLLLEQGARLTGGCWQEGDTLYVDAYEIL